MVGHACASAAEGDYREPIHSNVFPVSSGSFAKFVAIRRALALCNGRFRMHSSCHYISTAAFATSQPFDELANRGIRPYSKTCKFPFSDHAFVTAREAPYQNDHGGALGFTQL